MRAILLAALHAKGRGYGGENGNDEIQNFLECFSFHFHLIFKVNKWIGGSDFLYPGDTFVKEGWQDEQMGLIARVSMLLAIWMNSRGCYSRIPDCILPKTFFLHLLADGLAHVAATIRAAALGVVGSASLC